MKYNIGPFKTLCIWFSNDPQKGKCLNFEEKIKKIEHMVNMKLVHKRKSYSFKIHNSLTVFLRI